MDPETKKARENAKTEQWEKERKKMCKVLTAKHFMIENFWNSGSKISNKLNEIEYLKTLRVIFVYLSKNIKKLDKIVNLGDSTGYRVPDCDYK